MKIMNTFFIPLFQMSAYYLISFLIFSSIISCSSLSLPINTYENNQYDPLNQNEENSRYLLLNDLSSNRYQRSSPYYPRMGRNTWFRVATYQQFKPTVSEEGPTGDHLMRWG